MNHVVDKSSSCFAEDHEHADPVAVEARVRPGPRGPPAGSSKQGSLPAPAPGVSRQAGSWLAGAFRAVEKSLA